MRIEELTLENCPPFIAAFRAASWEEAYQKSQEFLRDPQKQSAVWIRNALPLTQTFNAANKTYYENFIRQNPRQNFFRRDENFSGRSSLAYYLSEDEREAADLFAKNADLRFIQRIQVKTRTQTAPPHFDGWSEHAFFNEEELSFSPKRAFGGRRVRVLLNYSGPGPVLYEQPERIVIKPCDRAEDDGYLENRKDLKRAWRAPDNSMTILTRVQEWGRQAVLHGSPVVREATSENPRRQTVYDLIF